MNDPIRILIGGTYHDRWNIYRIDSDLLTPADGWNVSSAYATEDGRSMPLPSFITEGAPAKVMLGDDVILDGIVDDVNEEVTKTSHHFEMYGRDRASLLLDCSAPMLSLQKATLEQIIKQAVAPVGIKAVRYIAKPAAPRQKVQTEPGQTVWEWLQSACEANQVWPWMAPDGVLIIGVPDYKTPPVADLVMRYDGQGNNALSLRRHRSIRSCFSEVTVLGQSAGLGGVGHHDIRGIARDMTLPLYRPRIIVDGNCESSALATRRANKSIADGRMFRDQIVATVQSHRIATGSGAGTPWTPGVRVNVFSEPHGVNAVYFLIRRTFVKSRRENYTELHLIPDGTWLLNIPFIKGKRRSSYGKRRGHYGEGADDESE